MKRVFACIVLAVSTAIAPAAFGAPAHATSSVICGGYGVAPGTYEFDHYGWGYSTCPSYPSQWHRVVLDCFRYDPEGGVHYQVFGPGRYGAAKSYAKCKLDKDKLNWVSADFGSD